MVTEHVLRQVESRPLEPLSARHFMRVQYLLVGRAVLDIEIFPQGSVEILYSIHRSLKALPPFRRV
jgi:hypothetical protein